MIRYGLLRPEQLPIEAINRSHAVNASVPKSFYERLLKSVHQEGFRNPILVENINELKVVYGESRSWAANKLNIPIPAFINDDKNEFTHFELITTEQQALSKFKDRPVKFRMGPPLFFFGCGNG